VNEEVNRDKTGEDDGMNMEVGLVVLLYTLHNSAVLLLTNDDVHKCIKTMKLEHHSITTTSHWSELVCMCRILLGLI